MRNLNRRDWLVTTGAASVSSLSLGTLATTAKAIESNSDSLPMQLYKSLSEQQRQKVCLPIDSPRRGYVSNWWYIHPDYRIPSTFDEQQQELIKQIFDSLHSEEHQDAVNKQVLIDQYGEQRNAPQRVSSALPMIKILSLFLLATMLLDAATHIVTRG